MADLEDLRTKTGELLDEGLSSGVLAPEEHTWRRRHLAEAQTVDALEALIEDLLSPAPESTAVTAARASQMTVLSNRTFALADLARKSELVTILGSSRFDLTGLAPGQALTLELVTILGDAVVEIPPGVTVKLDCTPVMGDCRVDSGLIRRDGALHITGVVLMGSLRVVVKNGDGRSRR
jgi:hypothetical protein